MLLPCNVAGENSGISIPRFVGFILKHVAKYSARNMFHDGGRASKA
jgi:hypothetical protein